MTTLALRLSHWHSIWAAGLGQGLSPLPPVYSISLEDNKEGVGRALGSSHSQASARVEGSPHLSTIVYSVWAFVDHSGSAHSRKDVTKKISTHGSGCDMPLSEAVCYAELRARCQNVLRVWDLGRPWCLLRVWF